MLVGPLANDGQPWTKRFLHHIFRITDENGRITQVGETCDVLYIVSVAVGAQKGLALISLDWQAPHEVGQEYKGLPLQLGVFVIVVVDIPCLVSDEDRKSVV